MVLLWAVCYPGQVDTRLCLSQAGLNTPKKQLTAEQCENMVHRLGTQALTQKETTLHNATIKHIGSCVQRPSAPLLHSR